MHAGRAPPLWRCADLLLSTSALTCSNGEDTSMRRLACDVLYVQKQEHSDAASLLVCHHYEVGNLARSLVD